MANNVFIEMNFEIGSWASAIVHCCERIHRIRRVDFIFVGEPMQWACTEFQLGEKMILKKTAVLVQADDGKTVVIFFFGRRRYEGKSVQMSSHKKRTVRAQEAPPHLQTRADDRLCADSGKLIWTEANLWVRENVIVRQTSAAQ